MSRLTDIIDNHQNLDRFFSIIKHYGVSAEYLSFALISKFESESESNEDDAQSKGDFSQDLIDDLKQFCARF
jgi:hypothetical protein